MVPLPKVRDSLSVRRNRLAHDGFAAEDELEAPCQELDEELGVLAARASDRRIEGELALADGVAGHERVARRAGRQARARGR